VHITHANCLRIFFYHVCDVPFALFSESKIRFTGPLFIARVHLYSRGYEESEKSPTCITWKGSDASVLIRSLHTGPRDNANKKAYRVLDAISFPPVYAVENISQIFQSRGFTLRGRAFLRDADVRKYNEFIPAA